MIPCLKVTTKFTEQRVLVHYCLCYVEIAMGRLKGILEKLRCNVQTRSVLEASAFPTQVKLGIERKDVKLW